MNEPQLSSLPVTSFWVPEKRLVVGALVPPVLVASESSPSWIGGAWSSSYLEWTGWRENMECLASDKVTVMWWAHEWRDGGISQEAAQEVEGAATPSLSPGGKCIPGIQH